MGSSSQIWILSIPDPDPGPGGQTSTKSWILDPDPQPLAKLSDGWLKSEKWMDTLDRLVMGLAVKA
jgi:hypothetical protein